MKKPFIQFILFTGIFLFMWLGLSQIHWVELMNIRKVTEKQKEKLTRLILDLHKKEKQEVESSVIVNTITDIKNKICKANNIQVADITIHVFRDEVINAFALPGGHIIINSGLINNCDNPDMLAGVISHEIAHIQLDHITGKLTRELGLSTIIMATGTDNLSILKEVLHTLTSRGFDREAEREADIAAVEYMINTKADVKQLALFLRKISDNQLDMSDRLEWISTHPDTGERIGIILSAVDEKHQVKPIITKKQWVALKNECDSLH